MNIDHVDAILEGIAPVVVELVAKEVDQRVAALPVPKDGAPGANGSSVTLEDVRPLIDDAVTKAVAAIPIPNALEIDYDRIGEAIKETVAVAASELPLPKDGKDADPVDIAAIVAEVTAKIPAPQPGKDADPEVMRGQIADSFAAFVDELTGELDVA